MTRHSWGGARKGSGRKYKGRVRVVVMLDEMSLDYLESLKKPGTSCNDALNQILHEHKIKGESEALVEPLSRIVDAALIKAAESFPKPLTPKIKGAVVTSAKYLLSQKCEATPAAILDFLGTTDLTEEEVAQALVELKAEGHLS